jgi:hypothetical protein
VMNGPRTTEYLDYLPDFAKFAACNVASMKVERCTTMAGKGGREAFKTGRSSLPLSSQPSALDGR